MKGDGSKEKLPPTYDLDNEPEEYGSEYSEVMSQDGKVYDDAVDVAGAFFEPSQRGGNNTLPHGVINSSVYRTYYVYENETIVEIPDENPDHGAIQEVRQFQPMVFKESTTNLPNTKKDTTSLVDITKTTIYLTQEQMISYILLSIFTFLGIGLLISLIRTKKKNGTPNYIRKTMSISLLVLSLLQFIVFFGLFAEETWETQIQWIPVIIHNTDTFLFSAILAIFYNVAGAGFPRTLAIICAVFFALSAVATIIYVFCSTLVTLASVLLVFCYIFKMSLAIGISTGCIVSKRQRNGKYDAVNGKTNGQVNDPISNFDSKETDSLNGNRTSISAHLDGKGSPSNSKKPIYSGVTDPMTINIERV